MNIGQTNSNNIIQSFGGIDFISEGGIAVDTDIEKAQLRPLSSDQIHLINTMKAEIRKDNIQVVSFKLDDTLILRPFSSKSDIFCLMEKMFSSLYIGSKSFTELRCEAESDAKRIAAQKKKYCTLSDVYDLLLKKSKISPTSRKKLMDRECELEEYFCFARQCGAALFQEAKSLGKKVVIIADSLLPENTVKKIIRNCGFDGCDMIVFPKNLLINSQNQTDAFNKISEKFSSAPQNILHIGSNISTDVEESVKLGIKALYLSPVIPLMIKSGRMRGFAQSELLYDIDSEKHFALRCIFGLYAAYAFDVPQGKLPQSDFCGDDYMLGFIALGSLSLYKDFVTDSELFVQILGAMSKNTKMTDGRTDFIRLFEKCFGDNLEIFGYCGCDIPFRFFAEHATINDRMSVQAFLSTDVMEKWSQAVTEPEIVPIYSTKAKKSNLSKLADKLFQPGSQIRTIIDGILGKLH